MSGRHTRRPGKLTKSLEMLFLSKRRAVVPGWVTAVLALAAVGISIGSAVALHYNQFVQALGLD
jgi:hypothetical protein